MKENILMKAQKIIQKYNLYKTKYNNCVFKDEMKWDLKVIDFQMKGEELFKEIKENGCPDCPISILCNNCVEAKRILYYKFYSETSAKSGGKD